MTYIDGFVVPASDKEAFRAAVVFKEHGATRVVEPPKQTV